MSAIITMTGLGSGIDFSQVVDQLVLLEHYQIDRLEIWKSEWEDKIESIQGLNSRLLSLESFVNDYNTPLGFLATTATSSDEEVLTATSTSTAIPGAHSITIGNNIPHRLATQGISDIASAVDVIASTNYNQDLLIAVGSNTITVDYVASATLASGQFDTSTTLEGLVTAINAADTNNYLTAWVIEDGSSDNKYRLVLTAASGGDDNRISVTSNPLNLNFNESNISNTVENSWSGAAVTSDGTSTAYQNKTYTFTASAAGDVGQAGSLEIGWIDGVGGSGSVQVGSGYIAGDLLTLDDGLQVSFASGIINDTEIFKVNVWNNVDSVEEITWDASSADPLKAGYYTGSTNKTFQFKALSSGTLGEDEIGLLWEDSEGNSGSITIPDDYNEAELAVYQGVKVKFDTTTYQALVANDTFSINVFHPTLQAGQDSGLAQVEQVVHSGFADEDTTAVTGSAQTFSYTYAGVAVSAIDVAADTTLSGLVGLINNDSDNPGVTASILNDGLGLSTSYHLVLTGRNTGAAYTITNITGFTNFSSSDFTTTQEAQNSMLKVDGYPTDSSQYLQRSSNSISDVIEGVTLSLVSSGSSATVSITKDLDTIRTNIETFVNGVNFVLDYIKDATGYDEDMGEAGVMLGNYSYLIVRARINQILTNAIPGLTDGVDTYVHLAQIGIKTNPDEDGKW